MIIQCFHNGHYILAFSTEILQLIETVAHAALILSVQILLFSCMFGWSTTIESFWTPTSIICFLIWVTPERFMLVYRRLEIQDMSSNGASSSVSPRLRACSVSRLCLSSTSAVVWESYWFWTSYFIYLRERLGYFIYFLLVVTHLWKLHCYHVVLVGYGPVCPKFSKITNHQSLWKR